MSYEQVSLDSLYTREKVDKVEAALTWYIVTLCKGDLLLRGEDRDCHLGPGMSETACI